jgi:tetratricopeptide (TPR) repeat protein
MYSLGVVQVGTNNARDGVASLTKALSGDPSLTSAYYYLGWGEEKLGNYDASLKYLNKTIQVRPSKDLVQRAYYQLSRVYRLLNRPADSCAALAQFTTLKQKSDEQTNGKLSELMKKHGASADDNSSDPTRNSTNAPNQP